LLTPRAPDEGKLVAPITTTILVQVAPTLAVLKQTVSTEG